MSTLAIRNATIDDTALILRFVKELADYEHAADEVVTTEQGIRESLFGADSRTAAVICEQAGEPIGFAVYFFTYSTWQGRHGIYLEDLYVTPTARGSGAGKALLRYVAGIAVARDCGRLEWSVIDWNASAIGFYEATGAKPQSEWIRYRLEGDSLQAFVGNETG